MNLQAKRLVIERLLATPLHGKVHERELEPDELEFMTQLGQSGVATRSSADMSVMAGYAYGFDRDARKLLMGLQSGVLRTVVTSAALDILADHDTVSREGPLWRWKWVQETRPATEQASLQE